MILRESDHHGTVDVPVNEPVVLELAENPTTGFRWAIGVGPGITIDSSDYVVSSAAAAGGGGVRRIVLHAALPGLHVVHAKLWREWEGDESVARRCDLTLRSG